MTEPVSVVLPTIGRPTLVRACLESLVRCDPRADEILVVDSSPDDAVLRVVSDFADRGARAIRCDEPGLGTAFNLGLRMAKHEIVLLTNDDCVIEPDWVGAGSRAAIEFPEALITGRVRPLGDPEIVPSTFDHPAPREYVGLDGLTFVLYTQSMAVHRTALLGFGGFDGRIGPSAEDNDLSYRWLKAGRPIRYEPGFVVWHADWRDRAQLDRLYVSYGVGQGMVYGKHLRRGDLRVMRFLAGDAYHVARGLAARIVRGRPSHADWRLGHLRGLPIGLVRGWRAGGTGRGPAST